MPFAVAEEGEEASGSRRRRSRAGRRLSPPWSKSLEPEPPAARRRKRYRRARSRLQSEKGLRTADAAVAVRGRKRTREADNCDDEEGKKAKKTSLGNETVAISDAAREEQEEEEAHGEQEVDEGKDEVSSAPSSPLCEPYIHREVIGSDSSDSETFRAYEQIDAKFNEKLARKMKLPTLDTTMPCSCLMDPKLLQIRESASKTVLAAGKFVFALSSSVGGEPLTQCTGFLIDRDQDGTDIILTSAHLIRTKHSSLDNWLCKDEYSTDAEITVHFPDNTTEKGHLLYYQKHYNIALFRSKVNLSVKVPCFSDDVSGGQMVFMLGRDQTSNLRISYGQVQFLNPNLYERYHFIYAYRTSAEPKCATGGPAIDLNGKVVGMSNATKKGSFVPASIILKWKDLWKKYGHIPRPHLGLKLWAIKFLDSPQIEKIFYKCGIVEGLIVKEVSYGSLAEKVGVRVGDIIEFLNGNCVSSMIELENVLLCLSEQHLKRKDDLGSTIDVEIGIFRTRKEKRKVIKMTLDVTDEGEKVVRGTRIFLRS